MRNAPKSHQKFTANRSEGIRVIDGKITELSKNDYRAKYSFQKKLKDISHIPFNLKNWFRKNDKAGFARMHK